MQIEPNESAASLILVIGLGDAADLTLGEGGSGSESKRYEYN